MSHSEETIQKVWEKGTIVPKYDSKAWRKDQCKAWISRKQYGNRESSHGWEIDHITPKSEGGTDELSNLRPLQWENNASKEAGHLKCVVTAKGKKNVPIE